MISLNIQSKMNLYVLLQAAGEKNTVPILHRHLKEINFFPLKRQIHTVEQPEVRKRCVKA